MTLWSYVADLWCTLMHPAPMWPSHGYYRCRACGREYPVPWEDRTRMVAEQPRAVEPYQWNPDSAIENRFSGRRSLGEVIREPAGTIPVVMMR